MEGKNTYKVLKMIESICSMFEMKLFWQTKWWLKLGTFPEYRHCQLGGKSVFSLFYPCDWNIYFQIQSHFLGVFTVW